MLQNLFTVYSYLLPTYNIHPSVLLSLVLEGSLQATKEKSRHQPSHKTLIYNLFCLQDKLGQC